jgi:hypothetical protein
VVLWRNFFYYKRRPLGFRLVFKSGHCSANAVASLAVIDSTLKLEYLNGLAQTIAPGLLASALPRTFKNAVESVSAEAFRLHIPLVVKKPTWFSPNQPPLNTEPR